MNSTSFGPTIRKLRKEQGLSQRKLAEKAGITDTTIILIENGKHGTTIDTASRLLEALGCEMIIRRKI